MDNPKLSSIEINPSVPATACVIWLHGLGANGHDFEPVVPHLGLAESLAVKFIFPNAPERPVTINQGYVMPAWYDIREMTIDRDIDYTGIDTSVKQINQLIQAEIDSGIAAGKIILAGFSQGGVIALQAGLNHQPGLAGVLALSTYLADRELPQGRLPIFIGHGSADPVVPISLGQQARARLIESGYPVEWHQYPMDHSVCMEEIRDIGAWFNARLTG